MRRQGVGEVFGGGVVVGAGFRLYSSSCLEITISALGNRSVFWEWSQWAWVSITLPISSGEIPWLFRVSTSMVRRPKWPTSTTVSFSPRTNVTVQSPSVVWSVFTLKPGKRTSISGMSSLPYWTDCWMHHVLAAWILNLGTGSEK